MAESAEDLTKIIPALEDQTWQVLQKNGADFLRFLSEDAILQFPFGMTISGGTDPSIKDVMTSESYIPWKDYRMSHVVVSPVGSDGAVISYKVKASRPNPDGEDSFFYALVGSVWRRSGDEWKMCFHQQTPYEPGQLEEIMQ